MKYLSLFSGIGGFELGIQKAYVEITNRNKIRKIKSNKKEIHAERKRLESSSRENSSPEKRRHSQLSDRVHDAGTPHCVGYSEIDKHAIKIYEKHFPEHKNYGDITKIKAEDLPEFDLVVGGFPCQSFSIAGKRGGFSDTRGTLFFDIARILKVKQPRLLLLENVKGLLSHDEGRTFATIISTLDELGYDLQWQVLNSKNFGVPQNRERVFIVGHLRGTSRPEVFPFGKGYEDSRDADGKNASIPVPPITGQGGRNLRGAFIGVYDQQNDYWRKDGLVGTLQAEGMKRQNRGFAIKQEGLNVRRLTPTECERLQGFPDGWTSVGSKIVTGADGNPYWKDGLTSDTQRYKTVGNAVTVNVISVIIAKLFS